jgi:hypothetical protein
MFRIFWQHTELGHNEPANSTGGYATMWHSTERMALAVQEAFNKHDM